MPSTPSALPILLRVIPIVTVTLFILLQAVLVPGLDLAEFKPQLALMGVFFWATSGIGMVSYLAAFLLGFLQDLLMGLPLGISALGFLLAVIVAQRWRVRPGSDHFLRHWAGFALCVCLAVPMTWLGVMAVQSQLLPPVAMVMECITTIALYPLIYRLLRRVRVIAQRKAL